MFGVLCCLVPQIATRVFVCGVVVVVVVVVRGEQQNCLYILFMLAFRGNVAINLH
jgi:hypothetical protein